jgi:hypothetical protein
VQGPQGAAGPQGVVGATGVQGAQGVPGVAGPPGPSAVSANAGNAATLGTDSLIFVPPLPAGSNATPTMAGAAAAGAATAWARGDHVHPTDTSRVAKAGDTMTGVLVQPGVTDGSNAAAGMVGEQLFASVPTGVALGTNTNVNVATLPLTAGDWVVSGVVVFAPVSAAPSALAAAISTASATLPTAAQVAAGQGNMTQYNLTFTNGASQTMQTGVCRVNLSAPASVYLVARGTFSGGSLTGTGYVSARRVR